MSGFVMPDRTARDRKESIDAEISILKDAMKALTENSSSIDKNDTTIIENMLEEYGKKIKALEDEKKGDDENITQPSADTIEREALLRANLQGQLIAAFKNPNPVSSEKVKERTDLFQKLRRLHSGTALYGGVRKKSKYNKRMTKKLMCPKNCCGLPVLKCNCPKSCGHCNCQEIKRLRRLLRKKTRKRKKHRKRNTKKRRKKRTKRRR
jgi:hypothetical protein